MLAWRRDQTEGESPMLGMSGMKRYQPSGEALRRHADDVALAAKFPDLLAAAEQAERAFQEAQAKVTPAPELRRLAVTADEALTAAMRAAYAAERAAIGERGYDDRIYRRKAKAKPHVRPFTAEAERLLTLRESHRLNDVPAPTFQPEV